MNILKVNLSILFISMPVCLLADVVDPSPSPIDFWFRDRYVTVGTYLCAVAFYIFVLWFFGRISVTILEALKLKTYHKVRSHLNKSLLLAIVLFIAGFALCAFRFRTFGHKKEPKKDPPVIRYDPPYDDSGIILDHDPRN